MIYNNPAPRIDNVLWLSRLSQPFPTTAGDIADVAKLWHFDKKTLDFLHLFADEEVFTSREDFLARSEELELLLREESEMPAEAMLNPQD